MRIDQTTSGSMTGEPAFSHRDNRIAQPLRFVLPQFSGADRPEDIRELLRKRLIIVSMVFTAAPALYAVRAAYFLASGSRIPAAGGTDLVLLIGAFVLTLSLLLTLLRFPKLSMRSLRAIELVGFGHAIALFSWWVCDQLRSGWLENASDNPTAAASLLGRFWVLPFVGSIMAYGTLIPNTWRRCASVIFCMSSCPVLAVTAITAFTRNYSGQTLLFLLLEMSFWLAIAVGLAVFGAHRMDVLRQRAAEARTLGQYKLLRRLGSGGMGEVFLAEHVLLRRPCAIKLILPHRAGDPKNLMRFMQEVRATATLTHPNTIQVFDYGQTDDGTFYYVMEYLPGITLDQLLAQYGPLPQERAIHFLCQICHALHEAHSIGLIHRDIKPSNVIVCHRGGRHDTIKLLDFGLALPLRSTPVDDTLIYDDAIAGTPAYMSPEQAGGQDNLDVRSDIYSLGAVAYFILTGRSPFVEQTAVRVLAAHLYENPAPLSQYRSGISPQLEGTILKCLAKKPADRFPNVASLEQALVSCVPDVEWTAQSASEWWAAHIPPDHNDLSADGVPADPGSTFPAF